MQTLIGSSSFRARALLIALAALVVVLIAWNVPALSGFLYPFRLFVTYVHEAGHAIAAKLSGGDVIGFVVFPNGSGVASTAGGSRALILTAGYVGAALFGALLFYLANMLPRTRVLAAVLGVGLILFTLAYARPDNSGAPTALFVGLGFGMALLLAAWKLSAHLMLLVLDVIAMLTGLNAVLDLKGVFENSGATLGAVRNDAAAFSAQVIGLPPSLIALIWAIIAVSLLGLSVYLSVYKPLRGPSAPAAPTDTPRKRPQDETIFDILTRDRD